VAENGAETAPAAPVRLSELEVTNLLEAEKRLPAASRVRLAEGDYPDGEAVKWRHHQRTDLSQGSPGEWAALWPGCIRQAEAVT